MDSPFKALAGQRREQIVELDSLIFLQPSLRATFRDLEHQLFVSIVRNTTDVVEHAKDAENRVVGSEPHHATTTFFSPSGRSIHQMCRSKR